MRDSSPAGSPESDQSESSTLPSSRLEEHSSKRSREEDARPRLINRAASTSSTTSVCSTTSANAPIVLVYHESARSIVFRDHMRRAVKKEQEGNGMNGERTVTKEYITELIDAKRDAMEYQPPDDMIRPDATGSSNSIRTDGVVASDSFEFKTDHDTRSSISNSFQPSITPLPALPLGPKDILEELTQSPSGRDGDIDPNWTTAEREVVDMLGRQQAVVKTIKSTDWTAFLHRFQVPTKPRNAMPVHQDAPAREGYPFASFVTSCSLLPSFARKMRSYGSATSYAAGVVFALPQWHRSASGKDVVSEDEAAAATKTWCFPSGYAAKTEWNRDSHGELINGRAKALVPLSVLREYNTDYTTKQDYMISGRLLKGGLKVVPYNEIFVRVGGLSRVVNGRDIVTGNPPPDHGRSFDKGLGLPVALFSRSACYGHLISLIRTRARLMHVLGENQIKNIPLLLITPETGVRVLTESLQAKLLKVASQRLNPFQNPTIAHKTTVDSTGEEQLEQKLEELIDLDDNVRKLLTPEECARLAGGFGATDESVAAILREAMIADKKFQHEHKDDETVGESHFLQDIVNEGLAAAVRSGDYYASRQLLILYSLVASGGMEATTANEEKVEEPKNAEAKLLEDAPCVSELKESINTMDTNLKPPPPPPLDTDRLRSATNSDGLLSVLGAAQVLKSIQEGSAKHRTDEVILALDEWIEYGENSMAFRLSSWRDQRAAQGDLKIAMESDSSFLAFLSTKAVSNRKAFVSQLKQTVQSNDFCDAKFLAAVEEILGRMHSPCLRLELLQYVLGLDNRYSVAHVARSVKLAKTCLGL